jgi:hypothetical protein
MPDNYCGSAIGPNRRQLKRWKRVLRTHDAASCVLDLNHTIGQIPCPDMVQRSLEEFLLKPGASPLLFGEFLMQLCVFVCPEDISGELPPYEETYVSVAMDPLLIAAYRERRKRFERL